MLDLTVFHHNTETRSISAENITGGKGMGARTPVEEGSQGQHARKMGLGWKTNPFLYIDPGETVTIGDIHGSGIINHIWMTPVSNWRNIILRIYWDDMEEPSVEAPVADFFCAGLNKRTQISTLAVCVNPGSGLNCYWDMPFRKRALITLENRNTEQTHVYYQIDYRLCELPEDTVYFHAQYRRTAPVKKGDMYTIVDGIKGSGHYVGTYLLWETDFIKNNCTWIGEGEIKFYIDGDRDFPTICGTGLEDYFCGSYNFQNQRTGKFEEFTTPYTGMQFENKCSGCVNAVIGEYFGMYRWHLPDPIIFKEDLRVEIQVLGWGPDGYMFLDDNIESVAYWYQTVPCGPLCPLPSAEDMAL